MSRREQRPASSPAGPESLGDTLVLRAARRLGGGLEPPPASEPLARPPGSPPGGATSGRVHPVDRARLREAGCIDPGGSRSRLAEELRVVKRPLIAHAFAPEAQPQDRIIVVTSAVPGEGKTFTAVNLALSLGLERDANVLLIDGDQLAAGAAALLGMARVPGLSDLLGDPPVDPAAVLVPTDIDRLVLAPPGNPTAAMPELLGSRRMAAIVRAILAADSRRLIVIDAPPLLASSDALALAGLAGQVLFLVEAGSTPRAAVDEALHLLEGHPQVRLVLNRARNGRRYIAYGRYGPPGAASRRQGWLARIRRKEVSAGVLAVAAGIGLAAPSVAFARWSFVPRLTVGTALTDNVGLEPQDEAKGDIVLEVAPGLAVAGRSSRLRLDADYALQEIMPARQPDEGEMRHRLRAAARAELVARTAYVDLVGNVGQATADGRQAVPTTPFNPTSRNATEIVGGISPFLHRPLGQWGEAELRYRALRVAYDTNDIADGTAHGLLASVARRLGAGPLAWQATLAADRTRTESTEEDPAYESSSAMAALDTAYRFAPRWAALAGAGAARLYDESLDDPGHAGPSWNLGLAAEPGRRSRFLARLGQLHGEASLEGEAVWRPGPGLELTVRYRQGLASRLSLLRDGLEATARTGLHAAQQARSSDLAADPMRRRMPMMVSDLGGDATFRQKRGDLTLRAERGRHRGEVTGFLEERDADRGDDDGVAGGIEADATRRLSRRAALGLRTGWTQVRYDDGDRRDDLRLTLSWSYRLDDEAELQLGYDLYRRLADGGDDIAANTVFARVTKTF